MIKNILKEVESSRCSTYLSTENQESLKKIVSDTTMLNVLEKISVDNDLTRIVDKIINARNFNEIVKQADLVKDEYRPIHKQTLTKDMILERIIRFINCSLQTDEVNDPMVPTEYKHPLVSGQVVKVLFSGVGSEIDNEHFAIVWETKSNRDQVVVIPTTSLKPTTRETKNFFNIGKIPPFSKQTVVSLEQLTCVSRKRIVEYLFNDGRGNMVQAIINQDQRRRIEDGFRVTLLRQKTLLDELINQRKDYVPEFINYSVQVKHLHRPIRNVSFDSYKLITKYQLFNDPNQYEIKWHRTKLNRSDRKKMLKSWAYSIAEIDPISKSVIKDRDTKQQELYRQLLGTKII